MKKKIVLLVCALAFALCAFIVTGCSSNAATTVEKAPPLLPASHQGRYDSALGLEGCYGCHGASDEANPMLTSAPAIPDDHYVNNDHSTQEIASVRKQCITCHPQG